MDALIEAKTKKAPGKFRRASQATAALFLQQGLVIGAWAPQIPILRDRLVVGESVIGLIILSFGIGSLLAMAATGWLLARFGTRAICRLGALFGSGAVIGLTSLPTADSTIMLAFALGGLLGLTDVAMNAHAVDVERYRGRASLSMFHAFWSLGALIGALTAGFLIAGLGPRGHVLLMTTVFVGLALFAWPRLLAPLPPADEAANGLHFPREPALYLLGLVVLLSFIQEGAVIDWSAFFLRDDVGASLAAQGLGLAALAGTMTLMRFVGDRVREAMGPVRLVRYGAVLAATGFILASLGGLKLAADWTLSAKISVSVFGFVLAGLGLANIVPVAVAAAGQVPNVRTGTAIAVVTMAGYAGVLMAPASIGWLGEHVGFAPIFLSLSVLPLLVAGLADAVRQPN